MYSPSTLISSPVLSTDTAVVADMSVGYDRFSARGTPRHSSRPRRPAAFGVCLGVRTGIAARPRSGVRRDGGSLGVGRQFAVRFVGILKSRRRRGRQAGRRGLCRRTQSLFSALAVRVADSRRSTSQTSKQRSFTVTFIVVVVFFVVRENYVVTFPLDYASGTPSAISFAVFSCMTICCPTIDTYSNNQQDLRFRGRLTARKCVYLVMPWLQVKQNYLKIISAFVNVRLKWSYFSAWKLAWNYLEIISEACCSSSTFFWHVQFCWNNFEIISELFWRLK